MNLTKGRVMEGKKVSFLEWPGLALLFIGFPTVIATVVSFSIPYYLHNVTLANTLSTIIPIVLTPYIKHISQICVIQI